MLANVYTKTTTDRWRGVVIGSAVLVSFLLMAMAVYRDIDLSVYTELPEAFRSIVGIDQDADVGALAYNAVYSSYGALVLFSLALALGAAAIAGEERKGTIGLLLANPRSRSQVVLAKGAALVTLSALGVGLLWAGGLLVPNLLDVDVTGQDVGALLVHMFAGALFFGFLALAVGAMTGKTGLAVGVSAGLMVLSFFAVGFLPLFENVADLARLFPWYYFNGSDPLVNGINWAHVAVLVAGAAVLAAVALVGVNRRDLRERSTPVTLLDRLRGIPATKAIMDRLAGSARVSAIWVKTASDFQGLLLVVGLAMFLVMGVMVGAMYPALDDALLTLGDAFPEELFALFGGGDLTTPEGFYQVETFGMMAPIAVMIVTILIGARAVAGEEEQRTAGLLLANPVSRTTLLLQKAVVLVLFGFAVGAATFLGVAGGNYLGGLGMDLGNVAATSSLVALLGIVFGSVALLLGAATGRVRLAVWVAVGLALTSHVANAFLPFSESGAGLERWTPNFYYLTGDPLANGMPWGDALILVALAAILIAAAVPAFNRRDLRQH
jgi:ABC-2 type transport system permease protein